MLLQSCATQELWNRTNPEEYVQISMKAITEDEIKLKKIKYYRDDKDEVFYIEKNALNKLGDYSLRLFFTPITVTIDTAGIAIGIVILGALNYTPIECINNPECPGYHKRDKDIVIHRDDKKDIKRIEDIIKK